jgi:hypothetical protein
MAALFAAAIVSSERCGNFPNLISSLHYYKNGACYFSLAK